MVGYYQWSTYYWLSKELSMVKIHGRASIRGGMSSWGSFPSLWVIGEELGFVMIYGVGSCCCMSPNRFLRRARVVSKSEIRKALHLFYHHHHFKIQMTVGVNYFLSHFDLIISISGHNNEAWGLVSALMMNRKVNWVSFSPFSVSHDIGMWLTRSYALFKL